MKHAFTTSNAATSHLRSLQLLVPVALVSLFGASSIASAATLCVNPGGTAGCKASIGAAVTAAKAYDTIKVWPGTYKEAVVITKPLSLVALDQTAKVKPIIDAKDLPNGIFVNGMSNAPDSGVSNVLIAGFDIKNANYEGILIVNVGNATIVDNHVHHNNKGLVIPTTTITPTNPVTCPGLPLFETNEGADCGEGIHLIAAAFSSIVRNESDHNSGGILLTDETGYNQHNVITENLVHHNPYACGITMASHGAYPAAALSYGVMYNTVANNISHDNGLGLPAAGAGVGMFAPFPGTRSHGNVVIGNALYNNGSPGVAMHNHAYSPFAPPVDLNDNTIVGNTIYGNAADSGVEPNSGTAGISIFSVAPVTGTVILGNVISHEAVDILYDAPGNTIAHFNNFTTTGVGVNNASTGSVNATDNWWLCPGGPGDGACNTAMGPNIQSIPWLTSPF